MRPGVPMGGWVPMGAVYTVVRLPGRGAGRFFRRGGVRVRVEEDGTGIGTGIGVPDLCRQWMYEY